jgi:hypothetical protein
VLTDIATGWTECAPLLVREQRLLTEVLGELRKLLPFPLLGLDTDNDSVFMNETVRDYCKQAGIEFTRCRPYRKNDQAWVEQKNGAVVRRTIGYRRFEGLEAAAALARLYAVMRLFVNFFQPSFKLAARRVTAHWSGSAITPQRHPVSGSWRIPGRTRKRDAACTSGAPRWTQFVCCSKFVRPSSSSSTSRIGRPSVKRRSRLYRHWRSFSRVCAQHGKRVRSARPS